MNLDFLLKELGGRSGYENTEITSVTENAENVREGSLFVAVCGRHYDGNDFIEEAFRKGAAAVISDTHSSDGRIINVSDARKALSFLCSAFCSHPQDNLKMIGITGTNGKTTTARYLRHILNYAGKKCAEIGTLGVSDDVCSSDTGYTTPCPEVLFSELRRLADSGYEYCVLEVSSQALAQKRVEPITFELGIFTNMGSDHLDYHGNTEKYARAKAGLFTLSKTALINTDDAYSDVFEEAAAGRAVLYSAKDRYADFMAKNLRFTDEGISYIMLSPSSVERVKVDGFTDFELYNTLAALSAASVLGIEPSLAVKAIEKLPQPKGRMQKLTGYGIDVFIDFAHTPEAMKAVLSNMRKRYRRNIICVFGCGGDRDKRKRSLMGRVAEEYADTVIITSDNPRSEDARDIISDILIGINNKDKIFTEVDREKAITLAVNKASPGDAVAILGKGHEQYQCIGDEKKFFSDELVVRRLLGVD